MRVNDVKVKDLQVGDVFVGKDDVEYEIEEIKEFNEDEMYYWVKNLDTGISGISSSRKEAKAKVINR